MSVFFFFSSRRRHTRFDCDWSSDVCSSDLISSVLRQTMKSFSHCDSSRPAALSVSRAAGLSLPVLSTSARLLTSESLDRSEEHTSELQSQSNLVCRLLLEKKKRRQRCSTHVRTVS